MALNSSPVRGDIAYLRRRVKPGPAVEDAAQHVAAPAQQAAPPPQATPHPQPEPQRVASAGLTLGPSAGLTLGPATTSAATSTPQPTASTTRVRAVDPATLPFTAPSIDEVRELGLDDPVLRLNARESAIGSLIVSGVELAAWENSDGITGSETSTGEIDGTPVRTSGNRPLVGFDDSDAIVTLRHAGELRRALFVGRGSTIGIQAFDGSTATVERADGSRMFVLYLLRVGNLVELRAEPVDSGASNASVLAQFGFELTPFVAPRESRNR